MRKILALTAAIGAAFAMSNANAIVFVVDNFDGPDMFVADTTINGVGVSVGPVGPVNPPANTLSRTVTHDFIAGANAGGTQSNVTVGSQTFPAGALTVANSANRDSQVTIAWTIPAGFIPNSASGPASLAFDLLFSDLGVNFKLFYNGVLFSSQAFPAYDGVSGPPDVPGGPLGPLAVNFALTAAQQNTISAGAGTQELKLVIDGPAAWDLTLDSFGLRIPEPATLALVGLALAGAGVASRRRKA
jgi:hypothetical protein